MSNKIKFYRLEKGYTLEYLAYVTKLSCGYISSLELNKKTNPSLSVMLKISDALEESISDIFEQ